MVWPLCESINCDILNTSFTSVMQCIAMQCKQCNALQYAMQCDAMHCILQCKLCNALQIAMQCNANCNAIQCNAVQFNAMQSLQCPAMLIAMHCNAYCNVIHIKMQCILQCNCYQCNAIRLLRSHVSQRTLTTTVATRARIAICNFRNIIAIYRMRIEIILSATQVTDRCASMERFRIAARL